MAPAPRARSNRLLSPNRINDARMSRLVPRANRGGVPWAVGGGARANSRANLRSSSRASSRINLQTNSRASSRIKPREASPEKKRTNFVSRIFRCTQRTRCPLLIWMPRKRRRSSALKDRSLAMRQELAGRGSVSWRGPDSGCSRQREFSVAFGEKARDRWAARPG